MAMDCKHDYNRSQSWYMLAIRSGFTWGTLVVAGAKRPHFPVSLNVLLCLPLSWTCVCLGYDGEREREWEREEETSFGQVQQRYCSVLGSSVTRRVCESGWRWGRTVCTLNSDCKCVYYGFPGGKGELGNARRTSSTMLFLFGGCGRVGFVASRRRRSRTRAATGTCTCPSVCVHIWHVLSQRTLFPTPMEELVLVCGVQDRPYGRWEYITGLFIAYVKWSGDDGRDFRRICRFGLNAPTIIIKEDILITATLALSDSTVLL